MSMNATALKPDQKRKKIFVILSTRSYKSFPNSRMGNNIMFFKSCLASWEHTGSQWFQSQQKENLLVHAFSTQVRPIKLTQQTIIPAHPDFFSFNLQNHDFQKFLMSDSGLGRILIAPASTHPKTWVFFFCDFPESNKLK